MWPRWKLNSWPLDLLSDMHEIGVYPTRDIYLPQNNPAKSFILSGNTLTHTHTHVYMYIYILLFYEVYSQNYKLIWVSGSLELSRHKIQTAFSKHLYIEMRGIIFVYCLCSLSRWRNKFIWIILLHLLKEDNFGLSIIWIISKIEAVVKWKQIFISEKWKTNILLSACHWPSSEWVKCIYCF